MMCISKGCRIGGLMTVTMYDYALGANERMMRNLSETTSDIERLVSRYRHHLARGGRPSLRIVASGSSLHAALCVRDYMAQELSAPVSVVSPGRYVGYGNLHRDGSFELAVSQSGYSTNVIAAIEAMASGAILLTADSTSPAARRASHVIDYGAGHETVGFVTQGVLTLIEFLAIFATAISDSSLAPIEDALRAHRTFLSTARTFVDAHILDLSRRGPAVFVGDGPGYGVAREAALKFQETLKDPAMAFEGEEFLHGPEMQVVPGYHVFVIDEARGSERLAATAAAMASVSASTHFVTAHPKGLEHEIVVPPVAEPLLFAIPTLAIFQILCARIAECSRSWDVHPFLEAVDEGLDAKAEGYGESLESQGEVPPTEERRGA